MNPRGLAEADAALAFWRERLAAASRNVVELSELPAFLALKGQPGTGRTAEASRALVATMDELWQGVLLIGAAIDHAAAARQSGSRLWRGEEAASEVFGILEGESIEVSTGEMPVLNRGLLASPRACVRVTPGRLLEAMEQAFERAKGSIEALGQARDKFASSRAELAGMVAALAAENWPGAAEAQTKLDAAEAAADPLGALEQIEGLRPRLVAAARIAAAASTDLTAAQGQLAALGTLRTQAERAVASCRAATDVAATLPDQEIEELARWLERLARTKQSGQLDGFRVGLSRWRELAARLRAEGEAALAVATGALTRRDELRGRFGALRAKQAAREARVGAADPLAEDAARDLHAALFGGVARLHDAERLMTAYEAALARPTAAGRVG